jgi:hypothetical protein
MQMHFATVIAVFPIFFKIATIRKATVVVLLVLAGYSAWMPSAKSASRQRAAAEAVGADPVP